jgi:hypothetical protein
MAESQNLLIPLVDDGQWLVSRHHKFEEKTCQILADLPQKNFNAKS